MGGLTDGIFFKIILGEVKRWGGVNNNIIKLAHFNDVHLKQTYAADTCGREN